jgi:hypothetical protein
MIYIIGLILLFNYSKLDNVFESKGLLNTILALNSTEYTGGLSNTSSQRTHEDLIKTCSTFREILSTDVAYSCDYSMLYYQGQCERHSDLLKQNTTEAIPKAENDLSFCSDPRVGKYIQDHGLANAPRSPSLIPSY